MSSFFPGFLLRDATVAGTRLRLRTGGVPAPGAPALLLLPGQAQTHAMWHRLAPLLAGRFAVVCPDLPAGRTRRDLSGLLSALMSGLGHERFAVVGHDLGAHVAVHMAVDAPHRVRALALLEAVPVADHAGRADMAFELSGYPSCWFGQLHPKPEALRVSAPDDWFRLAAPDETPSLFHPAAVADYLAEASWGPEPPEPTAPHDRPAVDHRRRIACPTAVFWAERGRLGGWYDPARSWTELAEAPVAGGAIPSGHFIPEEAPDALAARLLPFLLSAEP